MRVEEFIDKYNAIAPLIYRDPGTLVGVNRVRDSQAPAEAHHCQWSLEFISEHETGTIITYPVHASEDSSLESLLDWLYGVIREQYETITKHAPYTEIVEGLPND